MVDWFDIRKDPIEAVEHGVDAADYHFDSSHTGPVSFGRISYPVAEVLPQETTRQDATNWIHRIDVNLYFDRGNDDTDLGASTYVEEYLHATAAVIDAVLGSLSDVPKATNYHPTRIEDYAGELDGTSLLLINIRFEVMTAVDPGTFD